MIQSLSLVVGMKMPLKCEESKLTGLDSLFSKTKILKLCNVKTCENKLFVNIRGQKCII